MGPEISGLHMRRPRDKDCALKLFTVVHHLSWTLLQSNASPGLNHSATKGGTPLKLTMCVKGRDPSTTTGKLQYVLVKPYKKVLITMKIAAWVSNVLRRELPGEKLFRSTLLCKMTSTRLGLRPSEETRKRL